MENSTDTTTMPNDAQAPAAEAPETPMTGETTPETPEETTQPDNDDTPWGDDFDPKKAWNLVKGLREDKAKLRSQRDELAAKLAEIEKSHGELSEKAQRVAELELELTRREIAEAKGVPAKLRRFLTGSTREEIEAAADELMSGVEEIKPRIPDLKQGNRGETRRQLTRADLQGMTPQEINTARKAGLLDDLLKNSQ